MENIELNTGAYIILSAIGIGFAGVWIWATFGVLKAAFIYATKGESPDGSTYGDHTNGLISWGVLWTIVGIGYFTSQYWDEKSKVVVIFTNGIIVGISSVVLILGYMLTRRYFEKKVENRAQDI